MKNKTKYMNKFASCPICGQVGGEVTPKLNDTDSGMCPYFEGDAVGVFQRCSVCGGEWVLLYEIFDIREIVKEDETI